MHLPTRLKVLPWFPGLHCTLIHKGESSLSPAWAAHPGPCLFYQPQRSSLTRHVPSTLAALWKLSSSQQTVRDGGKQRFTLRCGPYPEVYARRRTLLGIFYTVDQKPLSGYYEIFLVFSQKSADFENDSQTSWLRRNLNKILDVSVSRKQRLPSKQRENNDYYWVSLGNLKVYINI